MARTASAAAMPTVTTRRARLGVSGRAAGRLGRACLRRRRGRSRAASGRARRAPWCPSRRAAAPRRRLRRPRARRAAASARCSSTGAGATTGSCSVGAPSGARSPAVARGDAAAVRRGSVDRERAHDAGPHARLGVGARGEPGTERAQHARDLEVAGEVGVGRAGRAGGSPQLHRLGEPLLGTPDGVALVGHVGCPHCVSAPYEARCSRTRPFRRSPTQRSAPPGDTGS